MIGLFNVPGRVRTALGAFALMAIAGCAALIIAGLNDGRRTAFSADVPAVQAVVNLAPGKQVCQGPMSGSESFGAIELFLSAPAVGDRLAAVVREGREGTRLTAGLASISSATEFPAILLRSSVSSGVPVTICLTNRGPKAVELAGTGSVPGLPEAVLDGRHTGARLSVVFLAAHSRALISTLATAFGRAALFHPTWVGSWTFWLLLGLLGASFLGIATALGLAIRADETVQRT